MSVLIEAEEWPMIAGSIALTRLFKDMNVNTNGVEITLDMLDSLAEKYFNQFITSFSVVERDVERMQWYVNQIEKNPYRTSQYTKDIKGIMNEQAKKIKHYFADSKEYSAIEQILKRLDNAKLEEHIPMIKQCVQDYQVIASTAFINEKLTLNVIKNRVLNPYYGQVSFLQKSFYSKDTNEHIEQFNKDFIVPAKLELQFFHIMKAPSDHAEVIRYLDEHKDYGPFNSLLRAIRKMTTLSDIKSYFYNEVLYCSFIEGMIATRSYEEMMFSPLAFSKDKASNFNWDFNRKLPVPMSALARLILFLVPLGVSIYTRRIGNAHVRETLTYSGLVLSQQDLPRIIQNNEHYYNLRATGSTFGEAIIGMLSSSIDTAQRISNSFLILEFHSDYELKKTLLDYYHMPPYLVKYLTQYGNALKLLHHRELRDDFLRIVLQGLDPQPVIFNYLMESVKDQFHGRGARFAIRERIRILNAKKGVEDMGNQDKFITVIYYKGVELRENLFSDRGSIEEGPYRASGRKKLEGTAYRLINAAKSGNKQAFMDTIFRLYITANLEIPGSIFLGSYKEEGLDFETIASVFISGLLSNDSSKKKEDN